MSGNATDSEEQLMLDASLVAGTTYYIGLHTADPGDAESLGAEISTSGTGYVRQGATFVNGGGGKWNSATITFPVATADWAASPNQIAFWSVNVASSAGRMKWHAPFTTPQVLLNTQQWVIDPNTLVITAD